MSNIKKIQKKWLEGFKNSAFISAEGIFDSLFAHQFLYGKSEESYSEYIPHNFEDFYHNYKEQKKSDVIEKLIQFAKVTGITLSSDMINGHLEKFPDDFDKLMKRCYYIFKTLAHYKKSLNIDDPYHDNNGDIYFLLRIQSGESIEEVAQLDLFEDLELPDLYSKFSSLPDGYENDVIAQKLFSRIESSNESFYITGKAGTGKSTFIHFFALKTKKKILRLAFTGIAAINAGGQTIHSFFRFPFKPLLPEDEEITRFKNFDHKYKLISEIDTIIIDEVSMLRSDILEATDFSLRINGGDKAKRFGGKQLIFVGDIFQLPPVTNSSNEVDQVIFNEVYKSEYFFDSPSYKELNPHYFEFKISYRQKEDLEFVNLLDEVRSCKVAPETIELLNRNYNPEYKPKSEDFVINLTTSNIIATQENTKRLSELPYTLFSFTAEIKGDFDKDKYPTAQVLDLKKHSQIIFIKNDSGKKWVNGTIAKIEFISSDLIEIRLQNGESHNLSPETWENRKYKYDRVKRKVVSEVLGTFTQFPIKLAWAITIHESQGLTFDNVAVDLGSGAFINGQVYTALSRCRKLSGIVLKRKLRKEDIISDPRVLQFHETEKALDIFNDNND